MSLRSDNAKLYHHIHYWLKSNYIKPVNCEGCGVRDRVLDWANISGSYPKIREDYKVLCRSCHRRMDYGTQTHCKYGHLLDGNTYTNYRTGGKMCKSCIKASTKRWRNTKKGHLKYLQNQRRYRQRLKILANKMESKLTPEAELVDLADSDQTYWLDSEPCP